MSKFILLARLTPTVSPKGWRTTNLARQSWRMRMIHQFEAWAVDHRSDLYALISRWFELERPLLLRSDLRAAFAALAAEHPSPLVGAPVHEIVNIAQEAVCRP